MTMLCFLVPAICSGDEDIAEPISKEELLTIAERYVREKNKSWSRFDLQTEVEGLNRDNNWMVTIWRIPYGPGGHRYVEIDQKGNVVLYEIGE